MDFDVTPEEAQPYANKFHQQLGGLGGRIYVEKSAWDDAPYRTTFHMSLGGETRLYEVQGHLSFHDRLQNFAQWIRASRHCAELYIVTDGESPTTAAQFNQLKKNGVGLYVQTDEQFQLTLAAKNPALQVTPDHGLKYGDLKDEVHQCVSKFNDGARKDGLRDLCELVERETEKTLVVAHRKGWITLDEAMIKGKDWSDQINAMASKGIMSGGRDALIDSKLKDDLHSFRGARNLVDHQARNKRADQLRQRQFPERMLMGARLIADIVTLRRKIK